MFSINMDVGTIVTIFGCVMASQGFWMFVSKWLDKRSDTRKLLMALAKDRITYLGLDMIQRGVITENEYQELVYIVEPYTALGGNGVAKKVFGDIDKKTTVVSDKQYQSYKEGHMSAEEMA